MKKILIGKNDELSLVAEKIISTEDSDVVLNIPRFSKLGSSSINFELLKREAEASGKKLVIETVDEKLLLLAQHVGLEAYNPFFQAAHRTRPVSDIISPSRRSGREESSKKFEVRERVAEEIEIKEETIGGYEQEESEVSSRAPRRWKKIARTIFVGVIVIVVGIGGYAVSSSISKTRIEIILATFPWQYSGVVKADKSTANINTDQLVVPGLPLVDKRNHTDVFRASGEKYVERKASGIITIYNAFSSEPQPLVEKTRLKTPDGKIYRLDKNIVVPGAKIVDGKVVPVGISASVVADKPGADYNIGPVERFTIPGFDGSPKFTTFYASSDKAIDGGFVGKQPYPTETDIADAKKKNAETLRNSLQSLPAAKLPQEFKFLDGTTRVKITKQTVIPEVNSEGMFSIVGEAEVSSFGFKEKDVLTLLTNRARKSGLDPNVELREGQYKIEYRDPVVNDQGSAMSVNVVFEGTFIIPVDKDAVINAFIGKEKEHADSIIGAFPGVSNKSSYSLRPKWGKTFPTDPKRIIVEIK